MIFPFLTPAEPIIAFDLHGVIFKRDYRRMAQILWKFPNKSKLVLALCSPFFLFDAIKLWHNKGVAEQFIICLAQKHKRLLPFVPLGITIANTQKLVPETVALLRELHDHGYKLHIFSNIGSIIFADLIPQYPDVFALFTSATLPSQENEYTRKPYPHAFNNFFRNSGAIGTSADVIFIDDSISNIWAAREHGIKTIYFRSAAKLRKQLIALGIKLEA
jgi:FMN phosphatase YigB (HAD superfamily)